MVRKRKEIAMRITSKGQVTIPMKIREKMGLFPNTEVKFEIVGNKVWLMKTGPRSTRSRDLIARMRGKATVRMTTNEIMALTRG